MSDLLTSYRERIERCAPAARWVGDPLPAAFIDHHLARRAESSAWQRVADLAQRLSNASRVRCLPSDAAAVTSAVAIADALVQENMQVHTAYARAASMTAPERRLLAVV